MELDVSAQIDRLRTAVDNLRGGDGESLASLMDGSIQEVLAAAVRLYAACLERDPSLPAFPATSDIPSATEALMTVTAMLDAVQIEPFELGLWATWGIRGQRSDEK